jgi:hypothetical protein
MDTGTRNVNESNKNNEKQKKQAKVALNMNKKKETQKVFRYCLGKHPQLLPFLEKVDQLHTRHPKHKQKKFL